MRPEAARHPAYIKSFSQELQAEVAEDGAAARLQRVICAAHVARKQAVRRLREGKQEAAIALLRGVPELSLLVRDGRVDVGALLHTSPSASRMQP